MYLLNNNSVRRILFIFIKIDLRIYINFMCIYMHLYNFSFTLVILFLKEENRLLFVNLLISTF